MTQALAAGPAAPGLTVMRVTSNLPPGCECGGRLLPPVSPLFPAAQSLTTPNPVFQGDSGVEGMKLEALRKPGSPTQREIRMF